MKVKFDNINIETIATILPENELDLKSFIGVYGENEVQKIIKTTGIEKIRYVSKNTTSSDLCEQLGHYLFESQNINKEAIDGLVFVSQTRDHILPQTSNILQSKLGLSLNVVCFDLPLGCSGYIYGIFQAALLIHAGACQKVLVFAGDTTTRMLNPKDRTVSMVFGDAASATIVSKGSHSLGCVIHSDGSGAKDLLVPAGGFRLPSSPSTAQEIWDENKICRSQNDLFMDGMQILNFSLTQVPGIIQNSYALMNWNANDVQQYIFHQANYFMVNYLRKKLKLEESKVPIAVKEYGNTGPASIPLTLSDKFNETLSKSLENVIFCGFGVGLSWGTICTNLSSTKILKPIIYKPYAS